MVESGDASILYDREIMASNTPAKTPDTCQGDGVTGHRMDTEMLHKRMRESSFPSAER